MPYGICYSVHLVPDREFTSNDDNTILEAVIGAQKKTKISLIISSQSSMFTRE